MKTFLQFRNLALLTILLLTVGFNASAAVTVTYPNGGETLYGQTTYTITWANNDHNSYPTTIELFDGATTVQIIQGDFTESYVWLIPATVPAGSNYKIRVTQTGQGTDVSNAVFTILQTTVTSPNGGEVWAGQTTHDITWTSNAVGITVIELWDGTGWINLNVPANQTSPYSWLIPSTFLHGTEYKIRVTIGTSTDESNAAFTIVQTKVEVPSAAGIVWGGQAAHDIEFSTSAGSGITNIYLYNGANLISTIATGLDIASPYSWTIPASIAASTNYKIKITQGDVSFDYSDNTFEITQTTVNSPNGGEYWAGQVTHDISWSTTATTGDTKIYYTHNGTVYTEIAGVPVDQASPFHWAIPDNLNEGTYKIKVTKGAGDALAADVSNAYFNISQTVVSQPGGASFPAGSTAEINWTTSAYGNTIIDLYDNTSGNFVSNILPESSSPAKPYPWVIPYSTPAATYKIKLRKGVEAFDFSDPFTVTKAVKVLRPNLPGLSWAIGTAHEINWTGNVGNVKIELHNLTTNVANTLVANASGNTYTWLIDNDFAVEGNHYKIRVTDILTETLIDESDNEFAIAPAGAPFWAYVIQPTSTPLATLKWQAGTANLISWNDNFSGPVNIYLVNASNNETLLESSVNGSTWVWNILPGQAIGMYRIKIVSVANSSFYAISEMPFEITNTPPEANILVIQPNQMGLNWLIGSTYLISWQDNIPQNNVTIELWNADGSSSVKAIAANVPGSTYLWTISDVDFDPGTYTVKVIYNSTSGISTFPFEISYSATNSYINILQPNIDGITWVAGNPYLISWEDNVPGTVDIYYKKGGAAAVSIASNVAGSTYVWSIPGNIGESSDYRIYIESHQSGDNVSGISANDFDIALTPAGGYVTVLQPNGGEWISIGTNYLISWDDNLPEKVDIELVDNNLLHVRDVATDVIGTTHIWNTTGYAAGDFKIRVKSSLVPSLKDESNAVFHIFVAPLDPMVYPNPADEVITLRFSEQNSENCVIAFTDRFSLPIENIVVNTTNEKEINIPTSYLANGIYFLTITSQNFKITKKVLVQH